jgi:branched-chain amino acid aminotransferase
MLAPPRLAYARMAEGTQGPDTRAELASLDGEIRPAADTFVPATDEGLLRGDGAFEVIRVYDGRAFALGEHLERLERSALNLRLDGASPSERLADEAARLLEARGGAAFDGCLRIVLTRGGRGLLLTEQLPPGPERARLAFVTYAPTRVLDGIKSLSYAGNMLASRLARERGFDEALLVTPHGRVLEAPTSTLFWVEGGRLCTPPLDEHILASITRGKLIELLEVEERPCPTDELLEAQEAFLASTVREVQSVAAIEERSFPETGEVTRKAAAVLRAAIEAELG